MTDQRHYNLEDLLYLMARLRDPVDGCPWDLKQTFRTIVPSTIEEAYEVADAIERENYNHLQEELGDLLFQVVFYSQLAQEEKLFDFEAIVSTLVSKLVRRHPHVFPEGSLSKRKGDEENDNLDVKAQWEQIKQAERQGKGQHGVLDDVPQTLPALTRAGKLQKRASHVGFDWPHVGGVFDKLREEIAELEQEMESGNASSILEEIGDVLFSVVNLARHLKVDPETALRGTNRKFENRFGYIEQQLAKQGRSPAEASLAEMDTLWEDSKTQ